MSSDDFPSDYNQRIDRMCEAAASALRACRGDLLAQLRVCADYVSRGEEVGISHGELINFLGVSSRSVLVRAGYAEEEALRVMEGIAFIDFDASGRSLPPASL